MVSSILMLNNQITCKPLKEKTFRHFYLSLVSTLASRNLHRDFNISLIATEVTQMVLGSLESDPNLFRILAHS